MQWCANNKIALQIIFSEFKTLFMSDKLTEVKVIVQ